MAIFTAKKHTVSAWLFDGTADSILGATNLSSRVTWGGTTAVVQTSAGTLTAKIGDWIVCGIAGEFSVCGGALFALLYRPESEE